MEAASLCLHQLFQQQVARTPHAVAVVDESRAITYAELDRLTDALAGYLQQHGLGTDRHAGIFMEKCAEYIVAYIAILKAGGAYMPLELAYPEVLLDAILTDARPQAIITKSQYTNRLSQKFSGPVVSLDRDTSWQEYAYDPDAAASTGLDHLAYVVYSSGTTGTPKGILAPHRGAVHSYLCRYEFSSYQPGDRVACNVFFVWELLRPLLKGATVYVIPDEIIYDPLLLLDFLEAHRITEVLFTPSLLESVLNTVDAVTLRRQMAALQVVWLNGEVVTTPLKHRLLDTLPVHVRLLNTYSISECHDVANEDLRDTVDLPSGVCAVGRPIRDVTLRLLDECGQPVPTGEVGELFIGGPGLARGYLHKPELTAERFVVMDGERFYRTGDLAVLHPDGRLEIRGRCDFMVKIRGYSVQLGAIETALLEHAEVKSCAVVADGETSADRRLVAYVVGPEGATWHIDAHTGTCEALQTRLKTYLPHYMIPHVYVELERIPISPTTGKLDRKKLPAPTIRKRASMLHALRPSRHASREEQEQVMARLWEHVLQLEPGSLQQDVDFFEYGGHSLLAVELTRLIEQYFQEQLRVKNVYEYPTIKGLVSYLNHETNGSTTAMSLREDATLDPTIVPPSDAAPLSVRDSRAIFVTGATGFLGAFVLEELLRTTADQVEVYCLVRAQSGESAEGRERIVRNLRQYRLWTPRYAQRLVPVVGDLGQPYLGLLPERFQEYAEKIDFIFHCGALVNYVYPYAILKPAMVNGTHEVLRLACTTVAKPMHYISTNGIFPGGDPTPYLENADIDGFADRLEGGYGPAKWVAEKLVWEAVSRGLPVCLYRPGNIGHHTATGAVNPNDFQFMIMEASKQLHRAPDTDAWRFEMTPVDFLVQAIGRFAQDPAHFGQVYNVVQAEPTPARFVFDLLRDRGEVTDYVSADQWKVLLHASAEQEDAPLFSVLAQSLEDVEPYLTDTSTYDCSHFDHAVSTYGIERPATDGAYFAKLLA
jgi:amino acid adenylation domain-containing protein/thioester reductase-like protein